MAHPNWITPSGSIGSFPANVPMQFQLVANPVLPAVETLYKIISGELPAGLNMTSYGLIYGTPTTILEETVSTIVVRATDNLGALRDRSFFITITGDNAPVLDQLSPLSIQDSTWQEFPITYTNPIPTNTVKMRVIQGELPPGLEMNEHGLVRGYADPPITILNLGLVITNASATSASTNIITVLSTTGFDVDRPIVFSGTAFGDLIAGKTYYVKEVKNSTEFTITNTPGGSEVVLTNDSGFMTVTLPNVSVNQPTIRQYNFTIELTSPLGNDIQIYFITVVNQNLSEALGGPGKGPNTRNPTLLNTRPLTYDIDLDPDNFGYYILPAVDSVSVPGMTYQPNQSAYMGQILSNNFFSFHFLGKDFDGNALTYYYSGLPSWLTGDPNTGWIFGEPVIDDNTISEYGFSVFVGKQGISLSNPFAASPTFKFTLRVSNDINGTIVWLSESNLGEIYNSTISLKSVRAISDVPLLYRLTPTSGPLPENLTLLGSGEITGMVAYQPSDVYLDQNETQTFTFSIQAYSPDHPIINSTKSFSLTVIQQYAVPTENLYIKCTPSIEDRIIIRSLLDNPELIPEDVLFRPDDVYFGKAQNVVYQHAFGIDASSLNEYVEAVRKQHYWRNITLGEIKTAVAKNENGEVVYEVVYSEVIDNLVNPKGDSVSYEVVWPRTINLNKGPWYTSSTDIFTSYIYSYITPILTQTAQITLNTQDDIPIIIEQGTAEFYTSLDPGEVRNLYPNSLYNMRKRVQNELGSNPNFRLLPLWMTSQQEDGNTLGFTPAWVICYTKPGYANTVKNNIQTNWKDFLGNVIKLNQINFKLDRFTVDKSLTYDYDKNIVPPAWTGLPSATPTPDPIDSENFYVLFPRKTILPNSSEY